MIVMSFRGKFARERLCEKFDVRDVCEMKHLVVYMITALSPVGFRSVDLASNEDEERFRFENRSAGDNSFVKCSQNSRRDDPKLSQKNVGHFFPLGTDPTATELAVRLFRSRIPEN